MFSVIARFKFILLIYILQIYLSHIHVFIMFQFLIMNYVRLEKDMWIRL